jgi:hypothetical protein
MLDLADIAMARAAICAQRKLVPPIGSSCSSSKLIQELQIERRHKDCRQQRHGFETIRGIFQLLERYLSILPNTPPSPEAPIIAQAGAEFG